jgi:hypothetical protein
LKSAIIALFLILIPAWGFAQPKWKRSEPPAEAELELFHANLVANLPTAETLTKGDFQFEIAHRFGPPIKEGYDVLWGLDGPAKIRFSLGYGITNRLMVTLGRSNLMANHDLQVKYNAFRIKNKILPSVITFLGGVALNTGIPDNIDREKLDGDNFQYYIQLIYNTMFFKKKFGVGLVPSYLYNSDIFNPEKQYTFTLGNYYQYYFNAKWSLWIEYNPIISGYQGPIKIGETEKSYNSLAIGLDVETGGHFFKIFISNNERINPSQYLVGSDKSASGNNWRLGFVLLRIL